MAAHDPQMLKGILGPLLLHLVAQREDYGYSLVVRLRDGGFTDLTEGAVYPGLTRLESAGLLDSHLVRSSAGPARKYYRVTDAGRAELHRAAAAWEALAGTVDKILSGGEPS
ncbi:MAG: PadR family transcriptional regulator [Pseudonocardia sp.]